MNNIELNQDVTKDADGQSSAKGATLNAGLAAAEEILNDLLDPMRPPEMRRDNNWHLVPTVNVKVEQLKKLLELIKAANVN